MFGHTHEPITLERDVRAIIIPVGEEVTLQQGTIGPVPRPWARSSNDWPVASTIVTSLVGWLVRNIGLAAKLEEVHSEVRMSNWFTRFIRFEVPFRDISN